MTRHPPFITQNVSLRLRHTFQLNCYARYFCTITQLEQISVVRQFCLQHTSPVFILGGGSNCIFAGDYDGTVVHVCLQGKSILHNTQDFWHVRACAGEQWPSFVQWLLKHHVYGLENLADIPGTVGACPVQNIGAYGIEISHFIDSVRAFDWSTGLYVTLSNKECAFEYRSSIFKKKGTPLFVIVSVDFLIPKCWKKNIAHIDIRRTLHRYPQADTPQHIFQIIRTIRRQKLPNYRVTGHAGSFFTNPFVAETVWHALIEQDSALSYQQITPHLFKINAAWLIDQAGWKGRYVGGAAVYEKHALILINRDQATPSDVLTLAQCIIVDIAQKYDICLLIEPSIVSSQHHTNIPSNIPTLGSCPPVATDTSCPGVLPAEREPNYT